LPGRALRSSGIEAAFANGRFSSAEKIDFENLEPISPIRKSDAFEDPKNSPHARRFDLTTPAIRPPALARWITASSATIQENSCSHGINETTDAEEKSARIPLTVVR